MIARVRSNFIVLLPILVCRDCLMFIVDMSYKYDALIRSPLCQTTGAAVSKDERRYSWNAYIKQFHFSGRVIVKLTLSFVALSRST
jgi:hypothetical protein